MYICKVNAFYIAQIHIPCIYISLYSQDPYIGSYLVKCKSLVCRHFSDAGVFIYTNPLNDINLIKARTFLIEKGMVLQKLT